MCHLYTRTNLMSHHLASGVRENKQMSASAEGIGQIEHIRVALCGIRTDASILE